MTSLALLAVLLLGYALHRLRCRGCATRAALRRRVLLEAVEEVRRHARIR